MRFDEGDIAQVVERIRAGTEPIPEGEPELVVDLADWLPWTRLRRYSRLRTAVGTTPPALRGPELSDGVPIEPMDATELDLAWLETIELD